jgi:arabinan endo-1,5-alpha-L-arabinosidase
MRLSLVALVVLSPLTTIQLGCGGGGASSGSGGTILGPDAGVLADVSDNFQFKIKNASSGLTLGIAGEKQTSGAPVGQSSDAGTDDQLWHFLAMGNHQFNIENLLSHQVLGIMNASQASGAMALQWADNGTADHIWQFYLLKDGNYLVRNANSGLYLEDKNSDPTSSGVIDQAARITTGTGCTCQEWVLTSTGTSPYPAPLTVSGSGTAVHDPYLLKDAGGTYWLYGTHNTLASSTDLAIFVSATPNIRPDFPWWQTVNLTSNNGLNTDMWAPDVMYSAGTYYQYYALPFEPHSGPQAIIALLKSPARSGAESQ